MFRISKSEIRVPTLGAALASAALLAACQDDPPSSSPGPNPAGGVTVELQVRPVALAKAGAARPVDSASILVSASDLEPREFRFGKETETFSLPELPPGPGRRFSVNLYREGRWLYAGAAEADLFADRKNAVFLHCLPRFSRVSAGIHVPADFPRKVARAELRLWSGADTLTAQPDAPGEFLNFRLEEVPGDRGYSLRLFLWDDTGAVAAQSSKDDLWVPMGESMSWSLPLTTTFSQMQLGLIYPEPQETSVSFSFPAARRLPAAFGEVVFSEVFLSPAAVDSNSQGQWIELFNRTSDTLDLSGCKIARDGGGSTSKQAVLASGTLVPPGRGLVVGRSAYPYADARFPSFSVGTGLSRVEFTCKSGALKLDTITYSGSASDSLAVQTGAGKIAQLRPNWIENRWDPVGWCQVPSHPASYAEGRPTPGTLENGCPE